MQNAFNAKEMVSKGKKQNHVGKNHMHALGAKTSQIGSNPKPNFSLPFSMQGISSRRPSQQHIMQGNFEEAGHDPSIHAEGLDDPDGRFKLQLEHKRPHILENRATYGSNSNPMTFFPNSMHVSLISDAGDNSQGVETPS